MDPDTLNVLVVPLRSLPIPTLLLLIVKVLLLDPDSILKGTVLEVSSCIKKAPGNVGWKWYDAAPNWYFCSPLKAVGALSLTFCVWNFKVVCPEDETNIEAESVWWGVGPLPTIPIGNCAWITSWGSITPTAILGASLPSWC